MTIEELRYGKSCLNKASGMFVRSRGVCASFTAISEAGNYSRIYKQKKRTKEYDTECNMINGWHCDNKIAIRDG